MGTKLQCLLEDKRFEFLVTFVIVLNAVTIGMETFQSINPHLLNYLHILDQLFLTFFVFELACRIVVYRAKFFKDPWGIFDFLVVSIALLPTTGSLSVLRALRVLRTLRVITTVPTLRRVVSGLLSAIPGLGAVGSILIVIFYVGSVIATNLFGAKFPEWFGSIHASAYSLFQIMTLESWSMGIVRPVMEQFPMAWAFFVPFILVTTFTMLNLFIAVIVNAMHAETDAAADQRAQKAELDRAELLEELRDLRKEVTSLKDLITHTGVTRNPQNRAHSTESIQG